MKHRTFSPTPVSELEDSALQIFAQETILNLRALANDVERLTKRAEELFRELTETN